MKGTFIRDRRTTIRFSTPIAAKLWAFYEAKGWRCRSMASFLSAVIEEHHMLLERLSQEYRDLVIPLDEADHFLTSLGGSTVSKRNAARLYAQELGIPLKLKDPKRAQRAREKRAQANPEHTPPVAPQIAEQAETHEAHKENYYEELARALAPKLQQKLSNIEKMKEELHKKFQQQSLRSEASQSEATLTFKEGDMLLLGSHSEPDLSEESWEASPSVLPHLVEAGVLQRKCIWIVNPTTEEAEVLYEWQECDGSLRLNTSCSRLHSSACEAKLRHSSAVQN